MPGQYRETDCDYFLPNTFKFIDGTKQEKQECNSDRSRVDTVYIYITALPVLCDSLHTRKICCGPVRHKQLGILQVFFFCQKELKLK
jgi:hypothetical protein